MRSEKQKITAAVAVFSLIISTRAVRPSKFTRLNLLPVHRNYNWQKGCDCFEISSKRRLPAVLRYFVPHQPRGGARLFIQQWYIGIRIADTYIANGVRSDKNGSKVNKCANVNRKNVENKRSPHMDLGHCHPLPPPREKTGVSV